MQKQFTIELRVDYEDKDKNAVMHKAIQAAGRHVFATATLLAEGVKPQIAMFSDDFFEGHEDIKLFDDTIQAGVDQLDALAPTGLSDTMDGGMEGVSEELLEAMRSK